MALEVLKTYKSINYLPNTFYLKKYISVCVNIFKQMTII